MRQKERAAVLATATGIASTVQLRRLPIPPVARLIVAAALGTFPTLTALGRSPWRRLGAVLTGTFTSPPTATLVPVRTG